MKYVIIDLEMNPVDGKFKEERKICRQEVIEIGAVMLDENFLVLGEFKTLVKPQFSDVIFKKYETLTGITTQMVADAPVFADAYEMFAKWCTSYGGVYEVYAWSENDYKQIMSEMALKNYVASEDEPPLSCWFDFQKEFTEKLGFTKSLSLEKALYYAGIDFEGRQHDALWDAKNTAELFAIARDEKRSKETLEKIMEVLKPKEESATLGDMFNFGALMNQLA